MVPPPLVVSARLGTSCCAAGTSRRMRAGIGRSRSSTTCASTPRGPLVDQIDVGLRHDRPDHEIVVRDHVAEKIAALDVAPGQVLGVGHDETSGLIGDDGEIAAAGCGMSRACRRGGRPDLRTSRPGRDRPAAPPSRRWRVSSSCASMTATWASSVGSSSATSGWRGVTAEPGRGEHLGHEAFGLGAHLGLVGNDDDAFGDGRVGQRNDEQDEPCAAAASPPTTAKARSRRPRKRGLVARNLMPLMTGMTRDHADRPERHHDADGRASRADRNSAMPTETISR